MAWFSKSFTRRCCLTATLVLFFAISVPAAAVSVMLNPTGQDITLVSLIKVSDSVLGDTEVTITADNQIMVPKDSTLQLLEHKVEPHTLAELAQLGDDGRLSAAHFSQVGLQLNFDAASMELQLSVPAELSRTQQLRLDGDQQHTDFIDPAFLSGFINLTGAATDVQNVLQQTSKQRVYSAFTEAALNIGRVNLQYEARLENRSDAAALFSRQGTRLNLDFADQGTRLTVGDMFNLGTTFQDGKDILGIGLTRDFNLIPTRNARPQASQAFTLQRTSNVDVMVDGVIVERLILDAGSYDLSNIPLAQGLNDVELVITDRTGQQERVSFSVATGFNLLNTGEFEYSLMYGTPRELAGNHSAYLFDERVMHGYVDVGVAPWLTLGLNAQSREAVYQYGGRALFANQLGITELAISHSQHPEFGTGQALRLAFDAQFDPANTLTPQFNLLYEYQSAYFSGINSISGLTGSLNPVNYFVSAFGSVQISDELRAAANFSYRAGDDTTQNVWSVGSSLSGRFFSTPVTWSTRLNYLHHASEGPQWSTALTLSWPLSDTSRVVGRYNSERRQLAVDHTYQHQVGYSGGMSSYSSFINDEDNDADVDVGFNYFANQYEARAGHATRLESLDEDRRSHNTRLAVASSVAFAGDTVAIGRPVREAFALVKKHDSLDGHRVAVGPAGEHVARAFNDDAPALVPDLVAYTPQQLSYEVDNLPPGYDLGDGAFWLQPGFKRGYNLQVGSDAVLTVIGKLLSLSDDAPIALVAGTAVYLGDETQTPVEFFTNRSGVFAISGLRPGDYELQLNTTRSATVTLRLDDDQGMLIRMGAVYVD